METYSYWIESMPLPRFTKLERDLTVDVVVIGGGITGITAAYLAKKAGLTVALLERGRCARLDTGNTTAHLTGVVDARFHKLKGTFGSDAARAVWDAGSAAIDQIVSNIRAEDIACDFQWVSGFLHAPSGRMASDDEVKELEQEAETAQALGIKAKYLPHIPFFGSPGVEFAHQALFHPRKYLAALLHAIPGKGSHVFENSSADAVEDNPLSVKSGSATVTCRDVFLATHTPLMGKSGLMPSLLLQTRLYLYTSYALSAKIPAGKIPAGSFWNTADPYDYLRVQNRRGYDHAIFGGEDHKTGQETDTVEKFRLLRDKFLKLVPEARIEHRWSGQVIETNDGLPFIGETAAHQFAATGFSGNGMTFGTLGAMMAVDSFLKRKNPWSELFDIHHKKFLGGTWQYLKENADYPYYLVRDWVAPAAGDSLKELAFGEGKVLSLEGRKVAAYRDKKGEITLCSPVCPHLKCIVGWNPAEQTWDCPCHGSRFKATGEVITGPAEEDLEKLDPETMKAQAANAEGRAH